ncbi:MAG: NADH-quinone oxidoreductase subunit N [Cephaloticoccus sp.]|nr:NADH-quinone oxidoreductase subunit N [Cephaloticoccus sp.]MCF7759702.1 NADH-quinone oxidoreductase subunit N [Cephaloticoccus sp.]
MNSSSFIAFLPELVLLTGALVLFFVTLGEKLVARARLVALITAVAVIAASILSFHQTAVLFTGAYRIDAFSQLLKLVLSGGFAAVLLLSGPLPDIRERIRPEYYLFLTLSVTGLIMLVSCVDVIALIIALELSSFPLYMLVPMRREREGQRAQMEAAVKYIMFGVAANGLMLFGVSYLFGLTGTTSLPLMLERLAPVVHSPLAIVGLALTFCGLFYKLAVFPFHFWTPDVYQGAANETASLIASLPKVGAIAVLVRFTSLASTENHTLALLLTGLAVISMFYGNLIALGQKDFKRLLGFSSIAHAGYAVVGFVALSEAGSAAALYYITGYMVMVLACFTVISRVSRDGTNVAISELAGLHRRSPLLAATLIIGVFGLAGIPPFVGFMGKLSLLTAALAKGYLGLVIVTMINAAIAVYYYLRVIREAIFGDPGVNAAPIILTTSTRILCVTLIVVIIALGVAPSAVMDAIGSSLAEINAPVVTTYVP